MKKAVTVDQKLHVGKKGKKNVASEGADVKAKPAAAKSGAEKVDVPIVTKPAAAAAAQPSSATSDASQVVTFADIR